MTPREPATAGELRRSALFLAPLTAAALIAQQVASNAVRDALFLTWFPVTTLPYFMAAAAVLAIPAAESSGRLLARFGPARLVPSILAVNSALFLAEWSLLGGHPRAASALIYFHASCAWSDRDLSVLVAAQRALRSALGQAAHGASGRGGRLWWPGWGRSARSA